MKLQACLRDSIAHTTEDILKRVSCRKPALHMQCLQKKTLLITPHQPKLHLQTNFYQHILLLPHLPSTRFNLVSWVQALSEQLLEQKAAPSPGLQLHQPWRAACWGNTWQQINHPKLSWAILWLPQSELLLSSCFCKISVFVLSYLLTSVVTMGCLQILYELHTLKHFKDWVFKGI